MGFLNLLFAFTPWILFAIISGPSLIRLKIAVVVCFLCVIVLGLKRIHMGIILWAGILFFAFDLVAVVILSNLWVAKHMSILASGTLAAATWFSILIRRPFTLAYARAMAHNEGADPSSLIYHSYILTGMWGCVFLANTLINTAKVYRGSTPGWVYEVAQNACLLLGMLFTMYYPKYTRRRQARQNQV